MIFNKEIHFISTPESWLDSVIGWQRFTYNDNKNYIQIATYNKSIVMFDTRVNMLFVSDEFLMTPMMDKFKLNYDDCNWIVIGL